MSALYRLVGLLVDKKKCREDLAGKNGSGSGQRKSFSGNRCSVAAGADGFNTWNVVNSFAFYAESTVL
jgi:hypothetical protein